ncbi:MAG: 4-(cytidine 5'-diphospho)-2-C-methyl-D-erythritol kinase [Verrucomicrobia subdivision 3 bacterium]|nr:4-(cytidine 5'-diphospho)-2-C-methyl-D-erythritol kinase [Limisphaerales bacterium]
MALCLRGETRDLAAAMTLEKESPCKVNLLLNVLGKRPDGFHELETLMHPVRLFDRLTFARAGDSVQLTCSEASLPTDERNLALRAARAFLETAQISEGVRVHLEKKIPLAAGLGGGSSNAACTLLGLNELFGYALSAHQLHAVAATLGSDVPFFLQEKPAIATGRGETIRPLEPFLALQGAAFLLIHPGFGVSTAWAYAELANFPEALTGKRGRAEHLADLLKAGDLPAATPEFYNSLEAPVLKKFPLLAIFKDFLQDDGAAVALMSGSGSTIFGVYRTPSDAKNIERRVRAKFDPCWTIVVPV